jgi:hypothetical protein
MIFYDCKDRIFLILLRIIYQIVLNLKIIIIRNPNSTYLYISNWHFYLELNQKYHQLEMTAFWDYFKM